ncbi:MAG: hypothetical protein L6311_04045 [Cellulomonas sp.]|nr:hypothetical protein [Cellulomonas sp.]
MWVVAVASLLAGVMLCLAVLTVVAHRVRRRPPAHDPFETLWLQSRLAVVADQVRLLERDQHAFARAHRMAATEQAYDALLAEACRMAGIEVPGAPAGDPDERFREEVELTSRGWSW